MKTLRFFAVLLAGSVVLTLGACAGFSNSAIATPWPTEYLATAIAETLTAAGKEQGLGVLAEQVTPVPTGRIESGAEMLSIGSAFTPEPVSELTQTPVPVATETPTPFPITLPPPSSPTPIPEIPEAEVQIYRLGDLSRVSSPLQVRGRLSSKTGKRVRVELYGEDGRLLGREVKVFENLPWSFANISTEMPFEIPGPAEVGRLVVVVEDVEGRIMALNSEDLILLAHGPAEINPPVNLLEPIVIQEPVPASLIQGKTVIVAGTARPDTDRPLHVELITADGRTVGQRLVGVERPEAGAYGVFAVEVPYTVSELTPVRLVVYEDGENLSAMTHLSSVEVMLSP